MKILLYFSFLALVLSSCEKELSQEGGTIIQPEPDPDPEPIDTAPKFQLKAFYSDIAIDFDESDNVVKSETDLWNYVLDYVKDDYHVFRTDSTMELLQNDIRKPGLDEETLFKSYKRGSDDLGDYLIYLTPDYNHAKYRLYEISESHFIIGLKWKDGARVYSRFERIN